MIKSAHSILGLTLGFWKRPFSQAQHKWCNTSNEDAIGRSGCSLTVHLSTQHSWHASALFLPLYQLDRFYRRIHWWASWSIICSEQKAKVRESGAAEICLLHCSQIVSAFAFFVHFILLSLSYFVFSYFLHLPLNDILPLTASPTDLAACDLPPLVGPFMGNAKVECQAVGGEA